MAVCSVQRRLPCGWSPSYRALCRHCISYVHIRVEITHDMLADSSDVMWAVGLQGVVVHL